MWIYIPSEFYPSAQELEASSLDLSSQSQLLEQSVMSRSKPLRAKSWLAAWKKKDWMQRLFGRILKPSMANLGAEKWIASLADIPASRLVLLEKKLGKDDPRHLWPDIKRLITKIKPPICFFENVLNHLRVEFEEVANDL